MNAYSFLTLLFYAAVLLIVVGTLYAFFAVNVLAFAIGGTAIFVITLLFVAAVGLYAKLRELGGIE